MQLKKELIATIQFIMAYARQQATRAVDTPLSQLRTHCGRNSTGRTIQLLTG